MTVVKSKWMLVGLGAVLAVVAAILIVPGLLHNNGGSPSQGQGSAPATTSSSSGSNNPTDRLIASLQQQLKNNPDDFSSHIKLANAYLQKYRENADPSLYTKAEALLDKAEKLKPKNPDLFATRGRLALGRHKFAKALKLGKRATALAPQNPTYYGVVGDAQLALGNYEDAISSYQEMVNRRPDFSSYSRISRMRELYGDPEGAIMAMQQAIDAGGSFPENRAWAYFQIGKIQWHNGHLDKAARAYDKSLKILPDYEKALAGQGEIAAARGDLEKAAALYRQATNRTPLPKYVSALGDIYARMGEKEKAKQQYDLVLAINKLFETNGVNNDLEMARFFSNHDMKPQKSLEMAHSAYEARSNNARAADVLAWNLYRIGNYQEAQKYSTESLRLGTRDPLKLYHAGMIAKKLGDEEQARKYLQQARDLNPHFWVLEFEKGV